MVIGPSVGALRSWASKRFHMWLLRTARKVADDPLEVRLDADCASDPEPFVAKVRAAVQLIRTLSPGEYDAVVRRFGCVLVSAGSGAEYWSDTNTCVLGARALDTQSPVAIALSIIHELGHAKIAQRVPGYRRFPESRIEAVCFRAELRFVRRLTTAGWKMTRVEANISDLINRGYPSRLERYQRRVARLRSHSSPEFVIRLYEWLRKPG